MHGFTVTARQIPSTQLVRSAAVLHVAPAKIMRDYYAVSETDDALRLVVGDMANNIAGTAVSLPELAAWAGLPADMRLNGGLAGSLACRQQLIKSRASGAGLVKAANEILKNTYKICGLHNIRDPASRFTGYVTHVGITPEHTTITAVGDVFAWVNGTLVAGAGKQIDTEKSLLVSALLVGMATDGSQLVVEQFIQKARLDGATAAALRQRVAALETAPPDRQAIYKAVDETITPWHIRHLQNKPRSTHPWTYGAIDGTTTPAMFIQTVTFPTKELQTLVVATDGSAPLQPGAAVRKGNDLQPVNSEFSEQTIVAVRRNNRT